MRYGVVEDLAADTLPPQTLLHRHFGELKFPGLRRNQGTAPHGDITRDRDKDVSTGAEDIGDGVFQVGPFCIFDIEVLGDPGLVQSAKCNLITGSKWPDANFGDGSHMVMLEQIASRGTAVR